MNNKLFFVKSNGFKIKFKLIKKRKNDKKNP